VALFLWYTSSHLPGYMLLQPRQPQYEDLHQHQFTFNKFSCTAHQVMECDVSDIGLGCVINAELVVRSTCECLLIFICYFYVIVRWREPHVSIKESWWLVHKHTPSLISWVILGLIPCSCGLQHKYQWNNLEISAFNILVWCLLWQVSTLISSWSTWRWLITRAEPCRW